MADISSVSKAAKKNKKRKAKKTTFRTSRGDEITPEQIIEILKEELTKAKSDKDHKKAGILRDQIWVLTDMVNGVRTDLPEEELEAIIANLPLPHSDVDAASAHPLAPPTSPSSGASKMVSDDKEMRKLMKKLEQIKKLKEKLASGEKLEKNQMEKIQSEESVLSEIAELEKLLSEALTFR